MKVFSEIPPFASVPPSILLTVVYQHAKRPARPSADEGFVDIDDDTWALIERAWDQDPKKRLSADEVENKLKRIAEVQEGKRKEVESMSEATKRLEEMRLPMTQGQGYTKETSMLSNPAMGSYITPPMLKSTPTAERIVLKELKWADACSETELEGYIRNLEEGVVPDRVLELWVEQIYQRYLRYLDSNGLPNETLLLVPSVVEHISDLIETCRKVEISQGVEILREAWRAVSTEPCPKQVLLLQRAKFAVFSFNDDSFVVYDTRGSWKEDPGAGESTERFFAPWWIVVCRAWSYPSPREPEFITTWAGQSIWERSRRMCRRSSPHARDSPGTSSSVLPSRSEFQPNAGDEGGNKTRVDSSTGEEEEGDVANRFLASQATPICSERIDSG